MKIKDTGHSIQVSIDGEDYALLKRTADTMNTVEWCEDDNTPESVFENFVICWIEDFFGEPGRMAENILDGVATDKETLRSAPGRLHRERLKQLEAAFKSAGLMG